MKGGGLSFGLQQSKQSLQRRLQMFLILKSLKTLDDRQDEIDKLSQIILSNTLSARRRNKSKIRKKKQQTRFDSGGRYSRDEELEENASYREREDDDDDSTTYDEKSQRGQDQPASSGGGGGVGVESPQILFDEPSDLSAEEEEEEEDSTHDRHQTSRTRTRRKRSTVGYELPYSTTSSAAVSRSNSRSSRHGNQTGVGTSGYASPILSTSPTEAALDLSGLGYALSRVREEGSNHVGVTIEGGGSESSDGITPTASAPGSIMAGHSGVGGGGNNLEVKKIRRRSLFLPTSKLIRRSSGNSTVSQGGDIGDSGLNVPEVIEGGGGGGGGEKLRRNLLRRNSSRNSAVLSQQSRHEMATVLGGRGLSLEDD